jgi:D-alanyl-D-alanine carboxypeptidase (penicillin-binding protein 5/6)
MALVLSLLLLLTVPRLVVAGAAPEPTVGFDVAAESAILIDGNTGQVLFEKNADLKLPPASMAKIMTMLLVMEEVDAGRAKLTDAVTVSARAAGIGGSQVYLKQGEVFTVEEMMKAVTVQSANDASVALAEHFSGVMEAFADHMNRRAEELGMNSTFYTNPDGLPSDPPTLTTARDLTIVARELLKHPKVFEWTTIVQAPFRQQPKTNLYNTNALIGKYTGLDGLKTGHTDEAGWCLTATAKRGDVRLVSVVMRTASEKEREAQTARLLDYGFRGFEQVALAAAGDEVGTLRIPNGSPGKVVVKAKEPLRPLVPRGREKDVVTETEFEKVRAPLAEGDRVGAVVAKLDGQELTRVDVVVPRDIKQANFVVRFFRWLGGLIGGVFRR